jgi:hypothetical protein
MKFISAVSSLLMSLCLNVQIPQPYKGDGMTKIFCAVFVGRILNSASFCCYDTENRKFVMCLNACKICLLVQAYILLEFVFSGRKFQGKRIDYFILS